MTEDVLAQIRESNAQMGQMLREARAREQRRVTHPLREFALDFGLPAAAGAATMAVTMLAIKLAG